MAAELSSVEIFVDLGDQYTDDVENLQPVVTVNAQSPEEPSRPKGLPFLSDIKKRGRGTATRYVNMWFKTCMLVCFLHGVLSDGQSSIRVL